MAEKKPKMSPSYTQTTETVTTPKDARRPAGDTGIADIYTADKGQPPIDPDMDSVPKKVVKKAKGGSASSRADGCCIRGKTRA